MPWRVYYDDNTRYGWTDGTPEDAPRTGVIAVVGMDQGGPLALHGHDYYWWHPPANGWWGGDTFGLFEHLIHAKPRPLVLFGRSIPTSHYHEIVRRASRDTLNK